MFYFLQLNNNHILEVLYMDIKWRHIGKKYIHGLGDIEDKLKKVSLFTPFYGTDKDHHQPIVCLQYISHFSIS